jgi:hypothetical protein
MCSSISSACESGGGSLICPHATRAPTPPAFVLPRSSGSACTVNERPTTLNGPSILTSASFILPLDRLDASATMLPSEPTCLSLSPGAPWALPCGL